MTKLSQRVRRSSLLLVLGVVLLWAARGAAAEAKKPGYLVVAPKAAFKTLTPLLELRSKHYTVATVSVEDIARKHGGLMPLSVRKAVVEASAVARPLRYVLLVGDTRAGRDGLTGIPTHRLGFDVWYGTLPTDYPRDPRPAVHQPSIAVGRFPAVTLAELKAMVDKTVSYETRSRPGPWQRCLHAVAGSANFSPQADALIDRVGTAVLGGLVPPRYDVTMTRGLTSSPYCYPPERFEQRVAELFNGGALIVAYVGHGSSTRAMTTTGFVKAKMFDTQTMRCLECLPERRPIGLFLACHMGKFDQPRDSVAEAALKSPGGPVAVISSVRRSHPYGNGVLGVELVRTLLGGAEPTLGRALLAAQCRLTHPTARLDMLRILLSTVAPMSAAEQQAVLIQHVYLYNLMGDPALRVAYPSRRFASLRATLAPDGAAWRLDAAVPDIPSGSALVTLEIQRANLLARLEPVSPKDPNWPAARKRNYARANRKVIAEARTEIANGRIQATLPAKLNGKPLPAGEYLIKAFAWNAAHSAAGATTVRWAPPK